MKVKPSDLVDLGDDALSAATVIGDAWTAALAGQQLSGSPAGDIAAGDTLVTAHAKLCDAADIAIGHLVDTLEQNMDDLYAVAFDMGTTDEHVAATYVTTHPRPAPSPGPAPTPPATREPA